MRRRIAVLDPLNILQGPRSIAERLGFTCIDVLHWADIHLAYVYRENVHLELAGIPLREFSAVLYSGVPLENEKVASDDVHFIRTERERALVAAFRITGTRVINSGWHLSDNWTVQSPQYQVVKLGELGWPVTTLELHLGASGFSRRLHHEECPKALVVANRYRHYIVSLTPGSEFCAPNHLLANTREYIGALGLDWATLALAVESRTRYFVCGFGISWPTELKTEAATALIRDALAG
jgi:hypothetical protein